jgi:uroporphyrinogen-III synthase
MNKIVQHYQGILFFSPSAVTSFFSKNTIDRQTILFAIGETTAGTLRMYTDNTIITGSEPAQENLVNAMILYYQSSEQKKSV